MQFTFCEPKKAAERRILHTNFFEFSRSDAVTILVLKVVDSKRLTPAALCMHERDLSCPPTFNRNRRLCFRGKTKYCFGVQATSPLAMMFGKTFVGWWLYVFDRWMRSWLRRQTAAVALVDRPSWWHQTARHTSPVPTSMRCLAIPSSRSPTNRGLQIVLWLGLPPPMSLCFYSICLFVGLSVTIGLFKTLRMNLCENSGRGRPSDKKLSVKFWG